MCGGSTGSLQDLGLQKIVVSNAIGNPLGSLLVVMLVVHKSWKARMDLGWDPREGLISFFGVSVIKVVGCVLIDIINTHPPQPVGS